MEKIHRRLEDFFAAYAARFSAALRATEEEVKIFAYITGDEQKALRDRGLIPD